MKKIQVLLVIMMILALPGVRALAGSEDEREARDMVKEFRQTDRSIDRFFKSAVGWAVLPSVAKGAFGIGAAHGSGCVFEKDRLVGEVSMTQITLGIQAGGQSFAELIFFETADALNSFKKGELTMNAQAGAVAAGDGESENASYRRGVVIFTMPKTGLMFEASVGGQKFTFRPVGGSVLQEK